MYLDAALFLLKIPPLQEIGGKISHIIEQYRAGILDEQTCLARMMEDHIEYIKKFASQSDVIRQQL